jgi:hypothetical protein
MWLRRMAYVPSIQTLSYAYQPSQGTEVERRRCAEVAAVAEARALPRDLAERTEASLPYFHRSLPARKL